MKRNRRVCKGIVLGIILTLAVCGCRNDYQEDNSETRIVLTTGFTKNEIFRIEKASCTLPEIMVYLMNTKNQYEEVFGKEIWNTMQGEITLEASLKETVLARIAKIKAMNLLANQRSINLSEEERIKVEQAAEEYYGSLNATEIEKMELTKELIVSMYEEYALANKIYEDLIADINPEISDDEARTITVEHVLIKTYTLNENGEKIPYTEQAKKQAYQTAKEVLKKAKAGEDFSSLIATYSEDSNGSYSFGKGSMDAAFEEAAFNLSTDEISNIVESSYGYHIIKCISTFDREESDRNKIKIVEQRRKEVFSEEYTKFVNGLTKNLNEELWETVGFLDDEEITTSSFFDTFQKYF